MVISIIATASRIIRPTTIIITFGGKAEMLSSVSASKKKTLL